MRVVEPRGDWDGVVRVEDVGRRRVIEDDRVSNWTAQLRQILQTIICVQRLRSVAQRRMYLP
jgi:hypothetical protein